MVMNSFTRGMNQPRSPLTETNPDQQEPRAQEPRAQEPARPEYRHKFSALITEDDFQLIRRIRFEHDVNYSTLLHAMFDYCLREGRLDIDSLPKVTSSLK